MVATSRVFFAIVAWIVAISPCADAFGKVSTSTSTSITTPSITAHALVASQTPPSLSSYCQPYPSNGFCKSFINYTVFTGNNTTAILDSMVISYIHANATKNVSPECAQNYLALACYMFFPKCQSGTLSNGTGALKVCQSQCSLVSTTCSTVLPASMLPNCINNPYLQYNDSNCLTPVMFSPPPSNSSLPTCPFPFLPDPLAGSNSGSVASSPFCRKGCCLKCPAQDIFYKDDMASGFSATNIIRFVSALVAGFMVVSYLVLPDKRSHPSTIILMLSISIFLFSIISILPIINARNIQCHDEVTQSTQSNNGLCAFQGAMVIFSSFSTCCWVAALILNMHISIVWNSNFFSTRYILLNLVCWGIPILMTVLSLANHYVQFEFGTLCLLSTSIIYGYFFIPLTIIIMPAFVLHLTTFFYIARISMKQGIETEMSRSVTSSNTKSRSFTHQRHVINAFKIQWRALLIAVIASATVIMYWIFYIVQVAKFESAKDNPNIFNQWFACALANPNDVQNSCSDIIAPYIPSFTIVIFTETLVSMVGLWLFVVFMRKALLQEWRDWIYDVSCFSRRAKNAHSEKDEQFFSL